MSDTYLTTANPLPPRTSPGTSLSSTLLSDSCIIYDKKLKYVKQKPECLRKCEVKKTQSTLKSYAAEKKDFRMLSMISTRDLIAAEAKYHPSCYQEYTRPKRKSKQMDDVTVAYKRVELEAYHVVIKTCHEMICKENIIKMQDLSNIMVNYLRMNGIKISNSTRKNLRRNIENTFGDEITFVTVSHNLLLYPTSMSKEKIFQELYKSPEEKNVIATAANIIRKEIKDLRDELPWPPHPADLEPDKFIIPSNLEVFLFISIWWQGR